MTGTPSSSRSPGGVELAYAQIVANVAVTSTNAAAPDTIVSLPALTFDGSTVVVIEFYTAAWICDLTTVTCNIGLYDGSTQIGQIWDSRSASANNVQFGFTVSARLTPTAGAHTYKAAAYLEAAATFTVGAGAGGSGNLMPAFIRCYEVVS